MLITVEDSVVTPTVFVSDEVELLPIARMERMGDPHGSDHRSGAGCS
jgi:hypothetical protein